MCRPLFPLVCVETGQSCCCCSPIHPSIHRILSIGWKERREEGGDGAVKRPCQNKLLPLGCRRHVSGLVGRDDAESDRFSYCCTIFISFAFDNGLFSFFPPLSLSCRLTTVTCQKIGKREKKTLLLLLLYARRLFDCAWRRVPLRHAGGIKPVLLAPVCVCVCSTFFSSMGSRLLVLTVGVSCLSSSFFLLLSSSFLDFYLGALELLTLSLPDSTHSAEWTDGRRISLSFSLPCVPEQITSISAFLFSSIDAQK